MRALREERRNLLEFNQAKGTQRGYASDIVIFSTWCKRAGRCPMPATSDTVTLFLTSELNKGFKITTVERRLAAISAAHKVNGHKPPDKYESRLVLLAARRKRKEQPDGAKALTIPELLKVSSSMPDSAAGTRDRAILVFGLASGLRRSELAAMQIENLRVSRKGIVVHLPQSKADQEGKGRTFGVFRGHRPETDPVRTMQRWLESRGATAGPLFTRVYGKAVTALPITGVTINLIVKNAVKRAGLDPQLYSAHSLRAGLVTAAAENGASDQQIMHASGHKTHAVMQKYIRYSSTRAFEQANVLRGRL